MLYDYVKASKDESILERALPLAEKEMAWWKTNRSLRVTSSYTGKEYDVYQYNVRNSAPRPEVSLQFVNTLIANSSRVTFVGVCL